MTKRKHRSITPQKVSISKIKGPKRPRWKRVLFVITVILAAIFTLLVMIGVTIKYYQLISH